MTLGPVRLPLPPSANRMYRSTVRGGRAVRYASKEYSEWLEVGNEIVRDAIMGTHGNMPAPDSELWWYICINIFAGPRRVDTDNVIKPVLDLLSGHYPGSGGKIEKVGLLFDDDNRVRLVEAWLDSTHHDQPFLEVGASSTEAPDNVRELAKAKAREEKAAARLAKKGGAK